MALDGETHLGEDGAGASRCFRMVDALTVGGEQDRMKAALFGCVFAIPEITRSSTKTQKVDAN